jgi:hypothetical protein
MLLPSFFFYQKIPSEKKLSVANYKVKKVKGPGQFTASKDEKDQRKQKKRLFFVGTAAINCGLLFL